MTDFEQLVKSRHSVRKYTDKKIEGEVLQELQEIINKCNEEAKLKMKLVLNEPNAFKNTHYGFFNNCTNYIVILGDKKEKDLDLKAGYYGEKVVLKAQELGLNTCWVALTYNKSEIPFEIDKNEKLIIVIAIGYGENNGKEHKSKTYDEVTKGAENAPEWFKRGVEFALLAPTAINQQKFKFELKNENEVLLKVAGMGFYTKVDLGIVKYHFELGAGIENFKWVEK